MDHLPLYICTALRNVTLLLFIIVDDIDTDWSSKEMDPLDSILLDVS